VPVATRATRSLVAETLDRLRPGGRIFAAGLAAAPRSSVNLGAAGIAYGLYRIASVRDDPSLLAAADIWLDRARRTIGRPEEWFAEEAGIMPRSVGPISLYHTRVGLYSVAAILNQALGDRLGQHTAIASFIAASRVACRNPDLTLGRSGVLLACALLLEGIPSGAGNDASLLTDFGNETMDWLVHRIAAWPATHHQRGPFPNLGMAHGWAGILYAMLRWHQCTRVPVPPIVSERLAQLAATTQSSGRGAVWSWLCREGGRTISKEAVPGWCNGSAGFVFLWSLAHRITGDEHWLALAEKAGLEAADNPSPEWSLCCGLTGRGFALLNLYKHTGDPRWLRRAKLLAARAVGSATSAGASDGDGYLYSLYRGLTGLTNFLVDLERPEEACLPMFEAEGWR
jgi:eukaryotic-like serine/threonine-protein kinase